MLLKDPFNGALTVVDAEVGSWVSSSSWKWADVRGDDSTQCVVLSYLTYGYYRLIWALLHVFLQFLFPYFVRGLGKVS